MYSLSGFGNANFEMLFRGGRIQAGDKVNVYDPDGTAREYKIAKGKIKYGCQLTRVFDGVPLESAPSWATLNGLFAPIKWSVEFD
jgi:hypothetical protein